jgi:hypothetical protein
MKTRVASRALALATVVGGAVLVCAPAVSLAQAPAAPAPAAASVNAEVMVMHATQVPGPGSIDEKIGNLPQLRKPPFSSYNTYRLLDKRSIGLKKGTPGAHQLPNARTMQVSLNDVKDGRFHVSASISQPDGKAFLKLLEVAAAPNEPFFVAGQTYQGGSLVIAITLRP